MKLDVFFSICQTEVDGHTPSESVMFKNFFEQAVLADDLGFGTAWVAETHLSTETQKSLPYAVVPNFKGEIGLNTDILQLAHVLMLKTKKIHVGSAVRNILCNGGPVAHAESLKTFLSLRDMVAPGSDRKMEYGFASGRFDFSNRPYGIVPRNSTEEKFWAIVKGKVLQQACEIFLRQLNNEAFSSKDIEETWIKEANYQVLPFWTFDVSRTIPLNGNQNNLKLTLGSHDENLQVFVNQFRPVGVFNLSITPASVIDQTHSRMEKAFHKSGGPWLREHMPRTCLVYVDKNRQKAKDLAARAWKNYWQAVDKTLDPVKVQNAVQNTISGEPSEVYEMICEKYHREDRLMVWFDFNVHDNEWLKSSMKLFMHEVAERLK